MTQPVILEMRGVRKSFGPVAALQGVDLTVHTREIHGLLGGNGAGKTTLMNVLYGLYQQDAGDIYLHGEAVKMDSPKHAIRNGIGMVHQHFLQIDNFTVAENIVLGTAIANRPTIQLDAAKGKVRELAQQFGLDVDPDTVCADLPVGTRQKVEILKALYRGVEVLVLDEPTTNLTPQEVDSLFESLRVMVDAGMSVVFITHKIKEALSVCDRISVLREGRNVFTLSRAEASAERLVQGMVGDDLEVRAAADSLLFAEERAAADETTTSALPDREPGPVLLIDGVSVAGEGGSIAVGDVSLTVERGEIVGIAGVAGNGQGELAESIIGVRPITQGRILVEAVEVAGRNTADLLRGGIAYIPEDRLHDGFLPTANVAQNLILGYQHQLPYSDGRFLNWDAIFSRAAALISEYNVQTPGPHALAANLSGGNIQRVILARALAHPCRLLVAYNPARGLDIPSTEFVYSKLLDEKRQGTAILLLSEDLDELLLLCDRLAVMYRGQIMGVLDRGDFDRYVIGRMMGGVEAVD